MEDNFFNNVNIGVVSYCNANCYICNRQVVREFPRLAMSIETFRKVVPYTKQIQFIGGFGDFINHPQSLDFVESTDDKSFIIETNAGIRDTEYWTELGKLANNENRHVQFSIDDITNIVNPYRRVFTETVLKNLSTFIRAGGYATVKTILFNFNQDSLDDMTRYFKEIGVHKFMVQTSMYYCDDGLLSAPEGSIIPKEGTLPLMYRINEMMTSGVKRCGWGEGKWLFIVENGEVHNCCKSQIYTYGMRDSAPESISKYADESYYDDIYELYKKNKDLINLNTEGVTLESAYNNEFFQYIHMNYKKVLNCQSTCKLDYRIIDKMMGTRVIYE